MSDTVDSPNHYTSGAVETIDKIEAIIDGLPAKEAMLLSHVIRYADRAGKKDDARNDLGKANNYAHRLVFGDWRHGDQNDRECVRDVGTNSKLRSKSVERLLSALDTESSPSKQHVPMEFYDVISPCTDEPCDDQCESSDTADEGRVYGTGEVDCIRNKGCMKTGGDGLG